VSRVVVDTPGVLCDSGDALAARAAEFFDDAKVVELRDVVAGIVPGRQGARDVTLYKSVGTALQDVAVAHLVYREAVRRGLGRTASEHVSVKSDEWRREGARPARADRPNGAADEAR